MRSSTPVNWLNHVKIRKVKNGVKRGKRRENARKNIIRSVKRLANNADQN